MEKKYLTVGTDEIRGDLFREIEDTSDMKPRGGLWLTQYDESIPNFNYWVDFMMTRPSILFHKSVNRNPFLQSCSVVTLHDNCNLYFLRDEHSINYLMRCFPIDDRFSYEKLSQFYDGIYVDLYGLYRSNYDKNVLDKFSNFDVNTLILFNLKCIDYYQSGQVVIEPFDPEDSYDCDRYYEIKCDSCKKKVFKK